MKILAIFMLCALFGGCKGSGQPYYTIPAPEDVVMYQVNPRVFAPSHSFSAIEARLDSIRALGVNVVWFMPVHEVGKFKSVNSPYCVKDYRSVNPEFGTAEEFRRLVELCHRKGMSVIIDWVANHTSWDHAWMEQKDWYTQDSAGYIISPAGTGWNDVADLNFNNPSMRRAMIDAMKYWVLQMDVDGFRCDAADLIPADFWQQALDSLRAITDRSLLMLAEGKRADHFQVGFDMNYGWEFLDKLREVYRQDSSATSIFAADRMEYRSVPEGKQKLRFTTNHDEAVKMSPLKEFGGEKGSLSAFVIACYLNGGVLIYGSQEAGYPGNIDFFRFVPVDWQGNPGLTQSYCGLLRLYNRYEVFRRGTTVTYPHENVVMFTKSNTSDTFLVIVNVRASEQTVHLPASLARREYTNMLSGQTFTPGDTLTFLPFEYLILKQ